MTTHKQRSVWVRVISLVAVGFGLLTIKEGGTVLFGGEAARASAGNYVPFVLWFNFVAGFAYVIEALAKRLLGRKWLVLEAGHTDIIANQKYVGDMEGRLQTYLKEMGKPRRLWFIPDLGALRATGTHDQNRSGALLLLLNHFEAGDVRVIVA